MTVATRMYIGGVALGEVGVQIVVNQPRCVVALEGEHHRQRVAQVVLRQVVAQRQQALVVTTNHATRQLHLGGIVEVDAGHIILEALLVAVLIPTVVSELVIFHHGLNAVVALHHAERETTVVVGLYRVALGIVYLLAVHHEVNTLNWDAGAVEHHVARESHTVGNDKLLQRLVVAGGIEGYIVVFYLQLDRFAHRRYLIRNAGSALVRQLVDHKVTALVGIGVSHRAVGYNGVYLHLGHACAVLEAHIALYATGMLALTHLYLGFGRVAAFALVHGYYLIFVNSQRRYAGILVAHLVDVGCYLLPSVITLTLYAALHGEVVYWVAIGVPCQQHAALACGSHQGLINLTVAHVVEVGQLRLVKGGIIVVVGCSWRHYGLAYHRPIFEDFFQLFNFSRIDSHYRNLWHQFATLQLPAEGKIARQTSLSNDSRCGQHWYSLATVKRPRISLLAVHQVHHIGPVALVEVRRTPVAPSSCCNSEAAVAIASPCFGRATRRIYTEPYPPCCEIAIRTGIIYTVERPATFAAPSDEATSIRGVSWTIGCNLAIEANISHIYICSSSMSQDTSGMGGRRSGHFCRHPHTVDGDSRSTNSATNQTCGMYATFDCTCYVQVFNSGIAYISERSGCAIISSSSIDVYIQRMAVTVECAAIASSIASSSITGDRNIIHEDGIYPILVLGIFHHLHERGPVGSASDGEYPILAGSMAVRYCHSTTGILSCPRLALVVLSTDFGGRKETAVNGCGTLFVNPTDETSITSTIGTFKATIELTVAYRNVRIGYATYETSKSTFAIHVSLKGNRRGTVLNGYSAIFDLSHEAGRIHPVRLDGTGHMQVPDGSIACMTERSNKPLFCCGFPLLVECQRMAITVEGTAEVSTFGYSYVLTDLNVGIEDSVHVVLVHSIIYHHSKLVPIGSITDDDKRRILTDGIAVAKGQRYIFRVTRPRFTVVSLSGDAVGVKETVVDDDIAAAVGPANKTTVAMAIIARKTTIELTGADNNIAIIFNGTNETTVSSIAIHAAVNSH